MDDRVHVTALFRAKSNSVDELIGVLGELTAPSREEPGCIEYGFTQDTDDPTVIIAVEIWRDREAIESHLTTQHFAEAFAKLGDLLEAEPVIHKCKKII